MGTWESLMSSKSQHPEMLTSSKDIRAQPLHKDSSFRAENRLLLPEFPVFSNENSPWSEKPSGQPAVRICSYSISLQTQL